MERDLRVIRNISKLFHQDIGRIYRTEADMITDIAAQAAKDVTPQEIDAALHFLETASTQRIFSILSRSGAEVSFKRKGDCKPMLAHIPIQMKGMVKANG